MVEIVLLILAAGAAVVDFYHRRAWIAIAVAPIALALVVPLAAALRT